MSAESAKFEAGSSTSPNAPLGSPTWKPRCSPSRARGTTIRLIRVQALVAASEPFVETAAGAFLSGPGRPRHLARVIQWACAKSKQERLASPYHSEPVVEARRERRLS